MRILKIILATTALTSLAFWGCGSCMSATLPVPGARSSAQLEVASVRCMDLPTLRQRVTCRQITIENLECERELKAAGLNPSVCGVEWDSSKLRAERVRRNLEIDECVAKGVFPCPYEESK